VASQNQIKPSLNVNNNFNSLWVGFAFGAVTASALVFLLGTKKGRDLLKKILDVTDNLQENALFIAEQIEEAFIEKEKNPTIHKEAKPVLGNLLDKMKLLRN